jgi:hypothetical protein
VKTKLTLIIISTFAFIALTSCGDKANPLASNYDSTSLATQSNLAQVTSQADQTENSYNLVAACSNAVRSSCTGTYVDTINWGGCTLASGAVALTGSWNETFSASAGACTAPLSVVGSTVTRTSASSTATILTGPLANFYIVTDTSGGTAWDGSTIASTGVTTTLSSATTRSVVNNGIHQILRGPEGTKWFDHFITSTGGLTITGSRLSLPRAISGTSTLYHNLAKYTATSTLNAVTWSAPGGACHYPTSGNISTTFSGSETGTTTLTFTATCGQATYVDAKGNSSTITLSL